MRAKTALACVMVCLATWAVSGAESSPFARMGWMEGHWTGVGNGLQMEEHWTSAAGDGLVGMHKDVKAGKMVSFEFFRIEAHADGIFYMTSPGGAPATPFKLIEQSDRRLVFENAKHDFPQRILYWSVRAGELRARIEGTLNGKEESTEWRWVRARR
jgi:hypothetical protein